VGLDNRAAVARLTRPCRSLRHARRLPPHRWNSCLQPLGRSCDPFSILIVCNAARKGVSQGDVDEMLRAARLGLGSSAKSTRSRHSGAMVSIFDTAATWWSQVCELVVVSVRIVGRKCATGAIPRTRCSTDIRSASPRVIRSGSLMDWGVEPRVVLSP
jgi:hypothetical protein